MSMRREELSRYYKGNSVSSEKNFPILPAFYSKILSEGVLQGRSALTIKLNEVVALQVLLREALECYGIIDNNVRNVRLLFFCSALSISALTFSFLLRRFYYGEHSSCLSLG